MRRVVENIECCRMILQLDIKIDVAIIFIRCIEKQFSPTKEMSKNSRGVSSKLLSNSSATWIHLEGDYFLSKKA